MSTGIVFVVGTGTDVGKTHVTALLVAESKANAWKPIATGVTDGFGDDARAIGATEPPLFAFAPPISPHLAARAVGVTITAAAIVARARTLGTPLLIESAGGLFSPISDTETNEDVAYALGGAQLLLVAPDRIGVIHDVGATVRATKLALPIIALSAPALADPSTGTNAAELLRLGLAKVVVEFPRGDAGDAAARLWRLLHD